MSYFIDITNNKDFFGITLNQILNHTSFIKKTIETKFIITQELGIRKDFYFCDECDCYEYSYDGRYCSECDTLLKNKIIICGAANQIRTKESFYENYNCDPDEFNDPLGGKYTIKLTYFDRFHFNTFYFMNIVFKGKKKIYRNWWNSLSRNSKTARKRLRQ